jgi:hypothetical protein
MMEAASTSETSVNFYETTLRNSPEDSHLHTSQRENLTSHINIYICTTNFLTTYFLTGTMMTAVLSLKYSVKSKAVPLHAMEAHGGRGGIALTLS